ncbi:TIGR02680 family protein [Amycolatopsis xylanica]|uniref:TIGR02680 family protein n=1 Tax=Amycolatopsis xylanica TaxID=589385 RepID=A0A1H3B9H8_9PSEU|nr:TIGR02680 family protein [Amycolatopsis xylanica]SDX38338.1 TIGR02680 family protein [Amycolatopsis xylanica]
MTLRAVGTPRWAPTRAGILNVWRYYDEIFEFHKGRLLLHGPNGTGKSKALELLLPFLFDASLRANRLSTFGTGERTMHWNLMGEGADGSTRVGYVWLEFALGDYWFTCGARLQASTHTKTVHVDYFTTTQRVGVDLSLVTDSGQPLTSAALAEAIGPRGEVHPSSAAYRTAVRLKLFPGLTEPRYDALITALLQLRQPKLSQRLDPALLSTLLSHALPPLGEGEVAELAEGFERLDRQREQLRLVDAEVDAARRLATQQRSYAMRVLRAAAANLISASSELTRLSGVASESAAKYDEAVAVNREAEQRLEVLVERGGLIRARIDGLVESESYKQGRELDELRERARSALAEATAKRAGAEAKLEVCSADAARAAEAESVATRLAGLATEASREAARAGERAQLAGVWAEMRSVLPSGSSGVRKLLRAAVRSRHDQLREVREAVRSHELALDRRRGSEESVEQARAELARTVEKREELAQSAKSAIEAQAKRLREWADGCTELTFAEVESLTALAESEPAVSKLVNATANRVRYDITVRDTTLVAERARLVESRAELVSESKTLESAGELPPEAPRARTTDRSTMDGAPFWKLVAFADAVPEDAQAGIEAALEASGLLDAWVPSHGGIEVDGHDTFLDAEFPVVKEGESLLAVLRPVPGAGVDAEVIERLLAGIAYGERVPGRHEVAIGADGWWRLANASGSWAKPQATHIGAVAREKTRQRKLAELAIRVGELDNEIARLDGELKTMERRRERLASELAGRPQHEEVDAATSALNLAESAVTSADRAVGRLLEHLAKHEQAVAEALRTLTMKAAENGLPTESDGLDAVTVAVDGFRDLADNWLDAEGESRSARSLADEYAEQARRSEQAADEAGGYALDAERFANGLIEKAEAVESALGRDYQQLLRELTGLREESAELDVQEKNLNLELRELATRLGSLDNQRTIDAELQKQATEHQDRTAARLRHLMSGSFPEDAGIKPPTSGDALAAADAVALKWPNIPHAQKNLGDALHRLNEIVYECREILSDRADLALETDGDVGVFSATVNGLRVGAAELLDLLRAEADRGRVDLTGAEGELFDKTLTGDTRRHLAARIRQATALVDAMNGRLEQVRTASKVAVRLVWQVREDLPAGTRTARELLLKDPDLLTDSDRESLHGFFRDRIEEAKADDTATSWEQQLAQVFDYTSWHQFVVEIDRANGVGWQLLTKKLHGALSGGEKAIALHLPLFAAVAAHYQAVLEAPRIILLDEVFVGVDTANRGQIFGLLSSLDLDLLLTSDHEWCDYRELDGIAIHKLITGGDGDNAVTTVRFVWDGVDLRPDEVDA